MKRLLLPAWILLALEVLCVVYFAVTKDMGNDAAGRGVATGFAIVLAPVVLLTGGLLLWASRGGPALALYAGLLLAFAPLIFLGANFVGGRVTSIALGFEDREFGQFDDDHLTSIARAAEENDVPTMRTLLAKGPVNWSARDRRGQTLLGHVVRLAAEEYEDSARVEPVRLLLASGAPVTADIIASGRTETSISAHDVVYHLFALHTKNALVVLDLLLARGLDPNTLDETGGPMYFTTATTLPALEVLARHGADFTRLDMRTDRPGWNGLMLWASMKHWGVSSFFLERGLSPAYVARDGATLRSLLAESDPPGAQYYGEDLAQHAAFVATLEKHPDWR